MYDRFIYFGELFVVIAFFVNLIFAQCTNFGLVMCECVVVSRSTN